MKFQILFTFLICLNLSGSSQIFYKSYDSQDLQDLKTNGVTYIKTGTSRDSLFEEYLKSKWTCSKYKIIDAKTGYKLNDHDVVLSVNSILNIRSQGAGTAMGSTDVSFPENVLCLFSANELKKNATISKNNIIGYVSLGGFTQGADPASIDFYLLYSISGLNEYAGKIIQQQIKGLYPFFNSAVADEINVNVSKLKGKTLLIIDNTIGHVITPDLDKNGIKYLFVNRDDFNKSSKDYETSDYYLLFFSTKSFTNVSIYNMANKNMIYTWFYQTGDSHNKKFDKKDIKRIIKYWNSK